MLGDVYRYMYRLIRVLFTGTLGRRYVAIVIVTTCLPSPKARDGHHVYVLWACWVWALGPGPKSNRARLLNQTWVIPPS